MDKQYRPRLTTWFCLGWLCFGLTGCAAIRNFPHNYTCASKNHSGCNHTCETSCNHTAHRIADEIPAGHPIEAIPAGHWEDLSKFEGRLETLTEKDESLQEQLTLFDKNAEKQRLAWEKSLQEMRDLASQMSSLRTDVDSQKK